MKQKVIKELNFTIECNLKEIEKLKRNIEHAEETIAEKKLAIATIYDYIYEIKRLISLVDYDENIITP